MSDEKQSPNRWRKIDGYHEKHQLIGPDGRFLGYVYGSEFEREDGWAALKTDPGKETQLGVYELLSDAKRALVDSLKKRRQVKEEQR